MNFAAGAFLIGLAAAAAPILIHLMNRRRYRVVQWAAMDFLAGAVKKNRRVLELRDMLLLILRILAIVLFSLAMARPYCSEQLSVWDQKGPSHVILIIDNSMSMNYRSLNESRFENQRQAAMEMLDALPSGSAVSIIPTCAMDEGFWRDDFLNIQDAQAALTGLEPVDASSSMQVTMEKVQEAQKRLEQLPDKRVIWLGDMTEQDWDDEALVEAVEEIGEMRLFYSEDQKTDNTWISELKARDGMADTSSKTRFQATVRHEANGPRQGVGVKFIIDGRVIEERTIDLEAGQSKQLTFDHRFDEAGGSDAPRFAHVQVSLDEDQLPEDDHRHVLVPVMMRVPVVFIDELGKQNENASANLFGQTFWLRRLLRPVVRASEGQSRLVAIHHHTPEQVEQSTLEDARLVVIGGVREPSWHLVKLLRDYVKQGGQLIIVTGESFSAEAWNRQAWQDGAGILPAMLNEEAFGKIPRNEDDVQTSFRLNPEQIYADVFQFNLPPAQLKSLYLSAQFFKTLTIQQESLDMISQKDREAIEAWQKWLETFKQNEERWKEMEAKGDMGEADLYQQEQEQRRYREMNPNWLKWRKNNPDEVEKLSLDELVLRMKPQVMARYDNGEIFALSREIGEGKVVLVTSGMRMRWNTLPASNAILLMDQMMRQMLSSTLPARNLARVNVWELPVASRDLDAHYVLQTPDQRVVPVAIEAMGRDRFGLRITDLSQRGIYTLWALDEVYQTDKALSEHKLRHRDFYVVNGEGQEGDLRRLSDERWDQLYKDTDLERQSLTGDIELQTSSITGGRYWKWLMFLALAILLGEQLVLYLASRRTST